jgi:cyclopropane fatty-acyl-phospholipid synthase-like methyltransferase
VDRDWRAEFERTYTSSPSAVQERVWRQVFGEEYPEGLDPYSYVSVSELDRFVREVRLENGDTLVDAGCGRGGPGLFVASAIGARLVGIDVAEVALEAARRRAQAMEIEARFVSGSFERTGLDGASADAVMSVDALLFTTDKAAALRELRRILRSDGRLVLTSWDYHRQPVGRPPQVDDHRPLLVAAGFETEVYDETEDWFERQRRTTDLLLEACDELAAESGETEAEVRAELEEMAATLPTISRRVFVAATAV